MEEKLKKIYKKAKEACLKQAQKIMLGLGMLSAFTPAGAHGIQKEKDVIDSENLSELTVTQDTPDKLKELPRREIDFQVDTLESGGLNPVLGRFNYKNNSMTLYHYTLGENSEDAKTLTMIHEQKHRDNYLSGMYNYPVSIEQAYKLDTHDEISANIASILALREKYIQTGDVHVFDAVPTAEIYAMGIANGDIKVNSSNPQEFDMEMKMLYQSVKGLLPKGLYAEQNISRAIVNGSTDKNKSKYYDTNYERALGICYNIGGVDFRKYMGKDVEISEDIMQKLHDTADKSWTMNTSNREIAQKINIPKYNRGLSPEAYQALVAKTLYIRYSKDPKNQGDAAMWQQQSREIAGDVVKALAKEYQAEGLPIGRNSNKIFEKEFEKLYEREFGGQFNREYMLKDMHEELGAVKLSEEAEALKNRTSAEIVKQHAEYIKNKRQNTPLEAQQDTTPKYREWKNEDGQRVSPVQQKEIIDMRASFVQQPQR